MAKINNVLAPVIDEQTKVLIVGSMPGKISLEKQQYYGNERNHFWGIMSHILQQDVPSTYDEKIAWLLDNQIGLWDAIASCERIGSLDSAIKQEVPNDFEQLLVRYPNVERIVFNGGKAERVFLKYFKHTFSEQVSYMLMPSTSPVPGKNVKSFEEKVICWQQIIQ